MVDYDIKSQLDLLNEYLDREMEGVKTRYFVIKPDGKGSSGNRPTNVDQNASTSRADESLYSCDSDMTLPQPPLSYKSNSVSFPQTVTKKRSNAIDIIDPETGEKLQLL
ncbi:uncharacterized protein LOC132939820 [Metopolophium dirhodum]|uniref:uncharacterized protein LOC132939820 n=1 Tax=Metopolophium dirhodum TaxID=44670 RepID=UPI0029900CBD|nr:uncharacterized protein LOC132939820 [Metopolophium dirhodum]XP_060863186.1 uncharacterized protein LOC132939820 [Metopolophium dirhodum]XP_060863187.1 uncharacterized protein LOC132939820 [Metopolophium dirhodum]XP_060863189.1 uncharacterized protein LOC132939820 [Metopolophium dirhodum]